MIVTVNVHMVLNPEPSVQLYVTVSVPRKKNAPGLCVCPEINATPDASLQEGSCHVINVPGVPSSTISVIGSGTLTHIGGVVSSVKG